MVIRYGVYDENGEYVRARVASIPEQVKQLAYMLAGKGLEKGATSTRYAIADHWVVDIRS